VQAGRYVDGVTQLMAALANG